MGDHAVPGEKQEVGEVHHQDQINPDVGRHAVHPDAPTGLY